MIAESKIRWRSLVAATLLFAACGSSASPSAWPDIPEAPSGWKSLGAVRGDGASGQLVIRPDFSRRALALNASCRGSGTLFVILGWVGVSASSGPVSFPTVAFPCSGSGASNSAVHTEIDTVMPSGQADVSVFVIENPGAVGHPTYAFSVEELEP